MKLIYAYSKFVAISSFEERVIPKGAGFAWDPMEKRWWTSDVTKAHKIAQYADDTARAVITRMLESRQESIRASAATDANINIPVPEGLYYLPYQRAGIAYAMARPSTLIADEMGLGKTIQAIGLINADASVSHVLVVCPASLKINWKRELERWLVRPFSISIVNGIAPAIDPGKATIAIINYDLLQKHGLFIHRGEWDLLIIDEAHYCKNPKAQRTRLVLGSQDVKGIKARRKLFLSGTPIVSRPVELWPIVHAIGPSDLGSSWMRYVERYCEGYQDRFGWHVGGASHLDELQEKLRGSIMVRRLKTDVLTELPPKRRQVIDLPAEGALKKIVDAEADAWKAQEERLAHLKTRVERAKVSDDEEEYKAAMAALREGSRVAFTEMSKLRHDTAVAKIPMMIDFLRNVLDDSDEKIVFFAHHHDVINAVADAFGEAAVKVTGETKSGKERQKSIDRFINDPRCRLFCGSIKATGVGLNLSVSSHVVFGELDWSPSNVTQAEDRTHRIGQKNSVLVQHLVIDGSIDARMARKLVQKQSVIDAALNGLDDLDDVVLPDPVE